MFRSAIFLTPLFVIILLMSCGRNDDVPPPPAGPNYEDSIHRGLWAYYNFDNGSFADGSGNNRPMRGANGIQFGSDKDGAANNALSFDGVNDYSIIDAGTQFPQGDFTLSLQFFAQRTSGGRLFNKGNFNDAKGVATTFGFDDDHQTNKMIFTVNKDADVCESTPRDGINNSLIYLFSGSEIAQNVWYSVVVSHINGVQRFYLNGQLVSSNSTSVQNIKACTNAPFYFGIWWLQGLFPYMGNMDNIRIYTRALSDNEIKYLSDKSK
jgi:hypothetical protein